MIDTTAHRIEANALYHLTRLLALRRKLTRDEQRVEEAYRDYFRRKGLLNHGKP